MADKKSKPKLQASDFGPEDAAPPDPSLGQLFTEGRERKGLTREQVAAEAHLPPHYVKMIETDSYDQISDRLYLVPFLRRYATFLGLDAEEMASRFVSNVQHAEANVVRISHELTMVAKKPAAGGRIVFAVLIAAVLIVLADLAWRHYSEREAALNAPVASPTAMAPVTEPNAHASTVAPPTIVTNPEAAAPPPADNDTAPQHPASREANDD